MSDLLATVGVIDYGMGNVGSILNMYRRLGVKCVATSDPQQLDRCERLILPGVGAFDAAMEQLSAVNLIEPLNEFAVQQRRPVLGICLGMQLMTESSEEGNLPGLAWIPASTRRFRFPADSNLKIPNMGWRHIQLQASSPLFASDITDRRFYFVHSYYVTCQHEAHVTATLTHGNTFVAAFSHRNLHGVQFHPEKSHRYGMRLLSDFAAVPC